MNEEPTLSLEELGEIKTVRVYNQAYVDKQQKRIEELEKENKELKELDRSYKQLLDKGSTTLMNERLKSYKQLTKLIWCGHADTRVIANINFKSPWDLKKGEEVGDFHLCYLNDVYYQRRVTK